MSTFDNYLTIVCEQNRLNQIYREFNNQQFSLITILVSVSSTVNYLPGLLRKSHAPRWKLYEKKKLLNQHLYKFIYNIICLRNLR